MRRKCKVGRSWPVATAYEALALLTLILMGSRPEGPLSRSQDLLGSQFGKDSWDMHRPVDISSQKMTADFQGHTITFSGNVVVTQADLRMWADTIVAVIGQNAQDIRKITAEGNVRVQKGAKIATGQKATYEKETSVVVVEGNPRLEQGASFVRGDKITLYLGQDQMDIQGGVKAEFQIPSQSFPKGEPSR